MRDEVCALLWGSPLAAEHVTPAGIAALFAGFGDVLEIDPTIFLGADLSSVKVVAKCERARLVPCDVWPKKGPWGTRVVQIEVIQLWPMERSFVNGVYQSYFGPPPPPPPSSSFHYALPAPRHAPAELHPAVGSEHAGPMPRLGGHGLGRGHQLLLTMSAFGGPSAPPPSPAQSPVSSPASVLSGGIVRGLGGHLRLGVALPRARRP